MMKRLGNVVFIIACLCAGVAVLTYLTNLNEPGNRSPLLLLALLFIGAGYGVKYVLGSDE